ncbi:MAG TPA: methyltransferase domain-containing protein [Microbacteriaceae bacterium]|nr:methyltransferase domain-containing protein [Microbacteriaceae bacterium]
MTTSVPGEISTDRVASAAPRAVSAGLTAPRPEGRPVTVAGGAGAAPAATEKTPLLGGDVPLARMPAHWMLGRLGKKVMRPGGLTPSLHMLGALQVGERDDVVDLWPGLGVTTQRTLAAHPHSYLAIERGPAEAARVRRLLTRDEEQVVVGPVHKTGLADGAASVLYGEALLTLEPARRKTAIVAEAARLLRPGGRYGIHELLLTPDTLSEAAKDDIERTLTKVLRVGARPLTVSEWRRLVEEGGFEVQTEETGKMLLLDIPTFLSDEGVWGSTLFTARCLAHPSVIPRITQMWNVFRRYRDNLGAIVMTARRA